MPLTLDANQRDLFGILPLYATWKGVNNPFPTISPNPENCNPALLPKLGEGIHNRHRFNFIHKFEFRLQLAFAPQSVSQQTQWMVISLPVCIGWRGIPTRCPRECDLLNVRGGDGSEDSVVWRLWIRQSNLQLLEPSARRECKLLKDG